MPKLEDYRIEFEDGTVRHQQLDSDGADEMKELANDKASDIKSVKKGSPDPINPAEQVRDRPEKKGDPKPPPKAPAPKQAPRAKDKLRQRPADK